MAIFTNEKDVRYVVTGTGDIVIGASPVRIADIAAALGIEPGDNGKGLPSVVFMLAPETHAEGEIILPEDFRILPGSVVLALTSTEAIDHTIKALTEVRVFIAEAEAKMAAELVAVVTGGAPAQEGGGQDDTN